MGKRADMRMSAFLREAGGKIELVNEGIELAYRRAGRAPTIDEVTRAIRDIKPNEAEDD